MPPASLPSSPARSSIALALATIYLIWGSTYLANKYAIESLPPFFMPGARFLIAGILLSLWLAFRGARRPTRRQILDNVFIGQLLLVGGTGLVVFGQQFIPSGLTALIIGASPLFFVLVEWAWPGGQSPTPVVGAALLLGFSGVAWLAAPWKSVSAGGLQLTPTLIILTGSVIWAIGSIYSRHIRDRASPLVGAAIQMLAGGAMLLLVSNLRGEWSAVSIDLVSLESLAAFVYLIVAGSLIAFPTFVFLMQHCAPATVSTYAYVNPVVAVALGWLVANEPVGPRTIVSATVILAAVAIITLQKPRPAKSARPA